MLSPQIETFIKVAESGSFSKTADEMYITPTAVMKQINALESRLGVTLFERTNHGLALTSAGKSLLNDAVYMSDYAARSIEKARDIYDNENQQAIRIGVSFMTPAKFILDIWSQLQEIMPRLKIELIPFENTPENSVEILRNLGQHIDIVAGLYDDNFLTDRCCKAAHLYYKKLLFAVPVTHPLSKNNQLSIEDFKGCKVMLVRKGWNKYIDGLREDLIANGVEIEEFHMFNISAFNRAAKENVPIVTIENWQDVHPLLKIIPADWDYKIPFGIFYSPEPSKQVRKFIKVVQSIIN